MANERISLDSPDRFWWSEIALPDRLLVHLGGELDLATKSALHNRLTSATESTAQRIQLDFMQVKFVDASCIGVIVRAWDVMHGSGRLLHITGLHGFPARVFDVCGLTPMMVRTEDGTVGVDEQ